MNTFLACQQLEANLYPKFYTRSLYPTFLPENTVEAADFHASLYWERKEDSA